MADVSENCGKNVLAESTSRTKEGNNACNEESKLNTVVESCDNKNLSVHDSSSCEKHDMTNRKQKVPKQVAPQKKEIYQENKKKDVNIKEDRINKDNKRLSISKRFEEDKRSEKNTKSSRRLSKSPIQRSISPRCDKYLRRSPIRCESYDKSPTFSPERYYKSPEWDTFPRKRSLSPPPYYVFKNKEQEYRYSRRYSRSPIRYDSYNISPGRYVSPQRYDSYNISPGRYVSPQRYNRSPGRYLAPRRRSWSPLLDYTVRYDGSLRRRRRSRSPMYFHDGRTDRDYFYDRQRSFLPKNTKDKNYAKIKSVMETGLVPPGMEEEFDLSSVPQQKRSIARDVALRTEKRINERHSVSPLHSKTVRSEKIYGEEDNNNREIVNPSTKRSCSPLVKTSQSKKKYECFLDEIEDIFMEKRKSSLKEDKVSKKKKSVSKKKLEDIDKELTLKKNKFLEKKRKSFLEEIEEKLQLKQTNKNISINKSATSSELQNNSRNQLHFPGTSPMPQLNLNMVVQPGNSHQLYNSQPQMKPHNLPQSIGQHGFLQQDALHVPQQISLAMQPVPQPGPAQFFSSPISYPFLNTQSSTFAPNWNQIEREKFENLFADKKTTLSECVRLAPKLTDMPVNIQNKIHVISRCQEAIKKLDRTSKSNGKFVVKMSQKKSENSAEFNGLCPFRRLRSTRFQFTTKQGAEVNHSMSVWLDKLLSKLEQKPVFEPSTKQATTTSSENFTPQKQQTCFVEKQSTSIQKSTASSSTQTEDIPCSECERRNNVLKNNIYTQTNEAPLLFDVSCQANLEELGKPVRGILKKQAISLLLSEELKSNQNTQGSSNYNPNMRNMSTSSLECSGPKKLRLSEHGFVGLEGEDEDGSERRSNYFSNADVNPYSDGNANRYPQESDLRDKIISLSNTRIFSRERPAFPKPFPSKTIPFGNFDHKLSLDFSKRPPYGSAPSTENSWRRYQ